MKTKSLFTTELSPAWTSAGSLECFLRLDLLFSMSRVFVVIANAPSSLGFPVPARSWHHDPDPLFLCCQLLDADVLVGHNIAAFDLTTLLTRMQQHKVMREI